MLPSFNKKIIRQNFSKAAGLYENHAEVQKIAAQKLTELASPFIENNSLVLDLGSGTGFVSQALAKEKNLRIFESDLSFEMLKFSGNCAENSLQLRSGTESRTRNRSLSEVEGFVQCDFENLPFKKNSFDILISSFSLQWLTDFDRNFANFFSLLKPNGILAFCLPSEESLSELRAAEIFNFNQLPKVENLKLALKKAQFREILFEEKVIKQSFSSGLEALKSIKKIGCNYFDGKKTATTKTKLQQFDDFCLKNYSTVNRNIEISWFASCFISRK